MPSSPVTSTPDTGLWLRRYHPARPGAPRVICFPHAGGSASWYHPMSAALSPKAEVFSVQYPGRQDRRGERPVDDLADLAGRVAGVLAGLADRPLVFFGHSMGAVVAFEVARAFAARGLEAPAHLVASGRRAPDTHRDERVHERDDDGVIAELKLLSGTDTRVLGDEEILRMIMPAVRADYRAIETYRCAPGSPLDCPVTVLTGDSDPKTSLDEAKAWAAVTTGPFELRVFAGGHFFLTQHLDAVLALTAELAAAAG
ncbi:thioesterase II family protein [Amycolatopsis magusensis]|uniref:Surfactin synthase thioesterase subunit n=1 Tax=Amycolatopsis magusensis TaxID=882444 RepID=A0ABS4Q0B5_9PSEU|nr:alpha/beta fold hydrolase [Amycolatopsis magusensis]MBP2185023.1 surfactin synthase thioesterase subunit [Amycolatopsis magusensis]